MQDQRIEKSVEDAELSADEMVLALIVEDGQCVWSVDELAREYGGLVDDSIARLYGAGLIHRIGAELVVAARAAIQAHRLTS